MDELKRKTATDDNREKENQQASQAGVSETWAQETIEDLDDFIESQGIYIRQ